MICFREWNNVMKFEQRNIEETYYKYEQDLKSMLIFISDTQTKKNISPNNQNLSIKDQRTPEDFNSIYGKLKQKEYRYAKLSVSLLDN